MTVSDEPLDPHIYSGVPAPPFPPVDWWAEADEERERHRLVIEDADADD